MMVITMLAVISVTVIAVAVAMAVTMAAVTAVAMLEVGPPPIMRARHVGANALPSDRGRGRIRASALFHRRHRWHQLT